MTESDFAGCLFNPMVRKGMIEAYPRLKEIVTPEDEKIYHCDMIIRYVCALYDKRSPLVLQEKDLNYRKSRAAEVAGLDVEEDDDFLKDLFACNNDFATKFIIGYLKRFMQSQLWAIIAANEFIFWEYTARLMKPVTGKTDKDELQAIDIKSRVSEELDKTQKRLDDYYKKFFGDDSLLEKAAKRWTPESVAKTNR